MKLTCICYWEQRGEINFCDVRYEQSLYSCRYCSGKTFCFCKDCCTKIHRHPDRRDHAPYLLSTPDNLCSEDQQLDYVMSDSMDDETAKLFRDAMMVATLAERLIAHNSNFKKKSSHTLSDLVVHRILSNVWQPHPQAHP